MRSLPHGPEFRFVDRLLSLTPGKEGVGEYLVRGDEYYLRGHLPGEPILPGVLLVEAGAQVAGMVAQEDPRQSVPAATEADRAPGSQNFRFRPARGNAHHRSHHHRPAGPDGPGQSFRLHLRRQSDDR